jgi:alanyl aminopeptidase
MAVDLTIDPDKTLLQGSAEISVHLDASTSFIWLNAVGLTVHDVTVVSGAITIAATAQEEDPFLLITTPSPLGPGDATLRIHYEAPIATQTNNGVFRTAPDGDGGAYSVYTQLEETHARQVFPCFDEPSFKVPWQLTLHVPRADLAAGNAPVVSETDEPGGMKRVELAPTHPLPSYLLAFVVGPEDVVDLGTVGLAKTPVRLIVPRGEKANAAFAAKSVPALLPILEDYFGMAYPYPKLDILAIPKFQAPGGMETPGLITCESTCMLSPPDRDDIGFERSFAWVVPHEMVHLWFGDYVTLGWWNDTWLNEAFATWLTTRLIDRWQPGWKYLSHDMWQTSQAMALDSRPAARAVRQPIASQEDIENSFDLITYYKGSALIAMVEAYLGPDSFRAAIRHYIAAHADGTATTTDFIAALNDEAHADLTPVFQSFLDKPGLPALKVSLACKAGAAPAMTVTQSRYLPLASAAASAPASASAPAQPEAQTAETWDIPLCFRFGSGDASTRQCTLLENATTVIPLTVAGASSCPDWVSLNDQGVGYYLPEYAGDLAERLAQAGTRVDWLSRFALAQQTMSLFAAGLVTPEAAVALAKSFATDDDPQIVADAVDLLYTIDSNDLVPDDEREAYGRLLVSVFGERQRSLGLTPAAGDSDDTRDLRATLARMMAVDGGDTGLRAKLATLCLAWLKTPAQVVPEMAHAALGVTAAFGDRALFETLHAAAKAATDPRDRAVLYGSLVRFDDPALRAEGTAILLSDEVDSDIARAMLFSIGQSFPNRLGSWLFARDNWDALVTKLRLDQPESGYILGVGGSICDPANRDAFAAFFKDRAPTLDEGAEQYADVLQQIDLCIAARARIGDAAAQLFKSY